jgi:UPF0755 protein
VTRRPRARRGLRRSPLRARRRLLILAAAACAVVGAILAALMFLPGPAARDGKSTEVVLTSGGGVQGVAAQLAEAGVIRFPTAFVVVAGVTGSAHSLKAGDYSFRSGASLFSVLREIRDGRTVRRWVTIPEGFTSAEAAAVVARSQDLTGDVEVPPEGSLLPETYQVGFGETRAHMIGRMKTARDDLLSRLWAERSPGLPYRSPEEAVILASIVEKETALPDERPHIAAVFINRLKQGMRLGSDPTVVYGLTGGVPLGHGLRVSELASHTPYNTYVIQGLPPTPIANPGKASLEAALNPTDSGDIYFVADGSGGHVFSATLAEHLKKVAHWRTIEHQVRGNGH